MVIVEMIIEKIGMVGGGRGEESGLLRQSESLRGPIPEWQARKCYMD